MPDPIDDQPPGFAVDSAVATLARPRQRNRIALEDSDIICDHLRRL